jgi:hypothetical protein
MKHASLLLIYNFLLPKNGGRTEYVITIACMIGKSRMKGEKVKDKSKYHLKNFFDGKKTKNIQQHLVQILEIHY